MTSDGPVDTPGAALRFGRDLTFCDVDLSRSVSDGFKDLVLFVPE